MTEESKRSIEDLALNKETLQDLTDSEGEGIGGGLAARGAWSDGSGMCSLQNHGFTCTCAAMVCTV